MPSKSLYGGDWAGTGARTTGGADADGAWGGAGCAFEVEDALGPPASTPLPGPDPKENGNENEKKGVGFAVGGLATGAGASDSAEGPPAGIKGGGRSSSSSSSSSTSSIVTLRGVGAGAVDGPALGVLELDGVGTVDCKVAVKLDELGLVLAALATLAAACLSFSFFA
jgi:hypothetical protein